MTGPREEREDVSPGGRADADANRGIPGDADLRWLLDRGRRLGAERVLDLGSDEVARGFAAFTPSVVAIERRAPGVAARASVGREPEKALRVAAADALPFRDASFGVVTSRLATHRSGELLPVVREVARVLRPGGSFLVEDLLSHDDAEVAGFMAEVRRRRDPGHARSFRQLEWTAFLRACGLTVIDEALITAPRPWPPWMAESGLTPEARSALERFVRDAPASYRDAFEFVVEGDRILSFTERMLLLRADKD